MKYFVDRIRLVITSAIFLDLKNIKIQTLFLAFLDLKIRLFRPKQVLELFKLLFPAKFGRSRCSTKVTTINKPNIDVMMNI